jgi:hypothetical protein
MTAATSNSCSSAGSASASTAADGVWSATEAASPTSTLAASGESSVWQQAIRERPSRADRNTCSRRSAGSMRAAGRIATASERSSIARCSSAPRGASMGSVSGSSAWPLSSGGPIPTAITLVFGNAKLDLPAPTLPHRCEGLHTPWALV